MESAGFDISSSGACHVTRLKAQVTLGAQFGKRENLLSYDPVKNCFTFQRRVKALRDHQ